VNAGKEQILLFLHVPKAAGSSLAGVVYREYSSEAFPTIPECALHEGVMYYPGTGFFKSPDNDTQVRKWLPCLGRHPVRAVTGHFPFGLHEHVQGHSTYLTMVREPAARITSLYRHLRRWHRDEQGRLLRWIPGVEGHPFRESTSLEEFVATFPLRELDNDQVRRISGREPAYGQCTSELLELAETNIDRHFSLVGVCERFDESLLLAKELLEWSSDPLYVSRLVNEEHTQVSDISPEARQLIEQRNPLDIELYTSVDQRLRDMITRRGPAFRRTLASFRAANSPAG
jgi:hypothetical protein